MKPFNYLFLAFLMIGGSSTATEYIILAEGTTIPTDIFTPNMTNAQVGDTITWVWVDGVHTTESVTIPAGAASWASNLDNSTTTFSYVVTVPGTYYYDCHASFSHGMDGYIEVSAVTTGINDPTTSLVSEIYPNPFTNQVTIKAAEFDVVDVYNVSGVLLKSYPNSNRAMYLDMDLSNLPAGIYFVDISAEGKLIESQKVVKR